MDDIEIDNVLCALSENNVVDAYDLFAEGINESDSNEGLLNILSAVDDKIAEFVSPKELQPSNVAPHGEQNGTKERFVQLKHDFYYFLGQAYLHELRQGNPKIEAVFKNASMSKGEDLKNKFSALLTEEAMLNLETNLTQEQFLEKELAILDKLDEAREQAFDTFLASGVWSQQDMEKAESLLLSPITDDVTVQLCVSAITLSCLGFFDMRKFRILVELYQGSRSVAVRIRALVGIALCDVRMPKFMEKEGLLKEVLSLAASDDNFEDNLLKVQKCLDLSVRSLTMCNEFSHKMMGDVMEQMRHMAVGETEEERVERITSNDDRDEDNEVMEAFAGAADQEREGIDLYIGQFKGLTKSKFFRKLSNWLMPFDEQNPTLLRFMSQNPKRGTVMMMMHNHTELCDSDLYGFIYLAQKIPQLLDNLWQQTPKELKQEQNFRPFGESRLLRNYVRQLYRFYLYGNKETKLYDPFTECLDNASPAYCFLSHPHYEDSQFRNLRQKAEDYAVSQGSSELVLSFYDQKDLTNFTNDDRLFYAESLMDTDHQYDKESAIDQIELVLLSDPDNLRAHFLTYLNECSSDRNMIRSTLALLRNQEALMAGNVEGIFQLSAKDFFGVKIKLMEAYIHTRQLEAALKIAYEMDYNEPGNDRVNACLAYCLLHRNPIMVSAEQIEKVESIIAPFLAQDLKTQLGQIISDSIEDKNTDNLFRNLANVFFTSTKKSLRAECVFEYCEALCSLSRHEEDKAVDHILRGLVNCVSNKGVDDDFMRNLFFPHGAEWLSQFGYDEEYLMMLYQRARLKIMDFENKTLSLKNARK